MWVVSPSAADALLPHPPGRPSPAPPPRPAHCRRPAALAAVRMLPGAGCHPALLEAGAGSSMCVTLITRRMLGRILKPLWSVKVSVVKSVKRGGGYGESALGRPSRYQLSLRHRTRRVSYHRVAGLPLVYEDSMSHGVKVYTFSLKSARRSTSSA